MTDVHLLYELRWTVGGWLLKLYSLEADIENIAYFSIWLTTTIIFLAQ